MNPAAAPRRRIVQILPTVTGEPGRLRGLDIPAGGLTVYPGPLGDLAQPGPRTASPQHLSHLNRGNLPERHPRTPSSTGLERSVTEHN